MVQANFNELSIIEKGIKLLSEGTLIETRNEEQTKIFLFELRGSWIEVFFIVNEMRIDRIKILEDMPVLCD